MEPPCSPKDTDKVWGRGGRAGGAAESPAQAASAKAHSVAAAAVRSRGAGRIRFIFSVPCSRTQCITILGVQNTRAAPGDEGTRNGARSGTFRPIRGNRDRCETVGLEGSPIWLLAKERPGLVLAVQ